MNLTDLPTLETKCAHCNGVGIRVDIALEEAEYACPKCNGSGMIPTMEGARILSLVRHNARLNISAQLELSAAP